MKNYFAIASMGLALSLVSCGKKESATASGTDKAAADGTYILATGDLLPPPGKTRSVSQSMEMKDAKLAITMAENNISGTMNQISKSVETAEPISTSKLRHVIVSESDKGTAIINGEEQPSPEKSNPLVGIPVLLELKDGKVTASLQSGTPNEEQKSALDKILKKYETSEDLVMYGKTPRKPGDSWKVNPSELSNFAGGTGLSGTFNVQFKSVEKINGVNCAKLECLFDLTGKTLSEDEGPQMTIAIKGKADVIRSIQDLVDLDVNLKATMAVEGAPAEGMKMNVNGTVEMLQTTELK